ncbi:putative phage abortive infection protein [Pseudomonas germanica]|uniref:putative phage abortive infection protein n=1 Tax=Pseudomonas germanica TaxID=2815720 RepID=UPI002A4E1581|nr:putative phage abortive infection protein [Pseudomonas germanica]WPN72478.1 putative phage abortive infection protein [Pseudomonas germanica]
MRGKGLKGFFLKFDEALFLRFEKIVGKSKDETTKNLYSIFRFALISSAIVFLLNIILRANYFSVLDLKLGEFGDFFGGVLNPILTFLMFIGLIVTIVVQKNELALARDEFSKTANALKEQSESSKKQILENTFFNLLKFHHEALDGLQFNEEILCCSVTIKAGERTAGRAVFSSILNWMHIEEAPETALENYTNFQISENHVVGHYFRGLYQILKFIDDCELPDSEKEKYSRILRAQLSTDEIALLFFNCICLDVDSGQFRALVVKFKLLEHMRLSKVDFWDRFGLSGRSIYTNKNDLLKYVEFDRCGAVVRSAFGKNPVAERELYKVNTKVGLPQYPI